MSEHDFEPIRGLPGKLPPDERLLWQGAPDWGTLASQVFHIRWVAAYFVVLLTWRMADGVAAGASPGAVALGAVGVALGAAGTLALLAGFAVLIARTTVYTVTSKRVVMRFGVALPKAINIPFTIIDAASLSTYGAKGQGNLALTLKQPNKIAYLLLWPHARPTKLAFPEPTFRAIPKAQEAATYLAAALLAHREREAIVPQSDESLGLVEAGVGALTPEPALQAATPLVIEPLRTAPA